ncbi:hydroxysteroid dehydrogenase-like protein 2 [Ptychodera flava]|uniref:hydroxysteroid dehydrogenase-like protein 2 n=1 Tax=Ptychodera flava TaxID=63121 RepID=UPI00396A6600
MLNTGKLAGKTLFITGASRGIGKAVALKAARDGANVVIAAKTDKPHPTLPGTIYTAAEEIEAAGGKCLPCIVDVRFEEAVQSAVDEAVKKFGGIDILVNNASAISLTDTLSTDMKKYDLMNSINARGTFLVSKLCIPYLKTAKNPHILNMSPPLNMSPKWFSGHVAYTMAKYGMSMCALGMAEEFKADGIAVNALWPRTAIITAAMEMLIGSEVSKQCRKTDIMADAAYVIFTKDSRNFTGNFCIDDEVLKDVGVTDFEKYSVVPGHPLLPDFFVEGETPEGILEQAQQTGATSTSETQSETVAADTETSKTFAKVQGLLNEELVKSVGGVFLFDLKGDETGTWYVDLKNGAGSLGKGEPPSGKADCTMILKSADFNKMFAGKLKPANAFMMGKLKIKGDMGKAMKLEKLLKSLSN